MMQVFDCLVLGVDCNGLADDGDDGYYGSDDDYANDEDAGDDDYYGEDDGYSNDDDVYDDDDAGLGPEEDGLVLGDQCGQWGLRRRVGSKGYRGRHHCHH